MTQEDLRILRENDNLVVHIHFTNGDVDTVQILFISVSEQDVIVKLVSSTNLERYKQCDPKTASQYLFKEIVRVEPLPRNDAGSV
jgi:hypothetical protein